MANAADARHVLVAAAGRQDVPALTRALTAVLDAAERSADPQVVERLGASPEFTAGFDKGVQYAADLMVASFKDRPSSPAPRRKEDPGTGDGTFAGSGNSA